MRLIFFLLVMFLFSAFTKAQIFVKKYTDELGYEVDITEAVEISFYNFTDTFRTEYTMRKYDFDEVLLRGIYRQRYTKDSIKMFSGVDTTFYKNGNIQYIIHYRDSKMNGDLLSYYDNGRLKRKEFYQDDSLQNASCYTKDGADTAYSPFKVLSMYPGGDKGMRTFLQSNIKYPEIALENAFEGIVIIGFVVQEDGSLSGFKVLKSPHYLLSYEALRVIKMMPNWTPGLIEGEPARMIMHAPVKFKIQDKKPKNK